MSAMAGADGSGDGSSKMFSGENEDGREYKRWKTWVVNKLLTLESKIPEKAHGAYVYTLLSGKALECVEHLEPSEYQVARGEKKLFDLLDARFPQKEATDEMSEVLTTIFNLKAAEGETLKVWISRASELFDRCKRKCEVSFPEEAKGWIILHRSGLNEEQKAVVLARSLGVMKRETIAASMRSCYPEFVMTKRKPMGISLVETEEPTIDDIDQDPVFAEVEAFLAEHDSLAPGDDTTIDENEVYDESEVAEALAISWKDKRKELGRLQRGRRFQAATDLRRSYKVEIEELKKKSRCNKCLQIGHWARECRAKGKGKGGGSKSSESGAAAVEPFEEHFVAAVGVLHATAKAHGLSTIEYLRRKRYHGSAKPIEESEVLLVSSPGFGVIDSGCGRTIIGKQTLVEFEKLWEERGISKPAGQYEINHFRFGNGERETSDTVVKLPVKIGGRTGTIKAAVVKGRAPLLISRGALQSLQAVIDFRANELRLFESQIVVPLTTNAAGQYVIDVLSQDSADAATGDKFDEVMLSQTEAEHVEPKSPLSNFSAKEPVTPTDPSPSSSSSDAPGQGSELQKWIRHDSYLQKAVTTGKQGPNWQAVRRRRIINSDNGQVVLDEQISPHARKSQYHQDLPKEVMHVTTEFYFVPQESSRTVSETLSAHCLRQVEAQVKKELGKRQSFLDGKPLIVAEVFSPPRFAPLIHGVGGVCKSYDLTTGFDFTKSTTRDAVAEELRKHPPSLLVLCPPRTDEGGWFNLNSLTMDMQEYLRRVRQSRLFIRYCVRLFRQQVEAGGQALFEHPKGSKLWTYPEVQELIEEFHLLSCHMCRYGLRIPKSDKLIRKATHLLVSDACMNSLARECPGDKHPNHQCHQTIAGSCPEVGSISKFAGKYTPQFVEAVMETVPSFRELKQQQLAPCPDWSGEQFTEVLAAKPDLSEEKTDDELKKILDKVHRNLGHPPTHDLVRILKHAQASDRAIKLAQKLECQFCKSQIRPHVPLPAKSARPSVFNQCIGIDVKNLVGWRPNQKIKALNIVDQASCYQLMIPFYETETSQVLKRLVSEHWARIFGPPKEVVMDQARTNMGDPLQTFLEFNGGHVHPIAGEAHWQLGRTERHGGWFARILEKALAEHPPSTKEEWENCVQHAHVKNSMIQSYGYTPHQHVFGKNPEVPTDLLSEPLHVIPATASLTDDAMAKSQAIRAAARIAVIQTQDDKALRLAHSARPRITQEFKPGEPVAYWRMQKYQQGESVPVLGGRWHGVAVIIGRVGKNYIISHRRQIFRVAPEQLRPATTEERVLVETPQAELLGIKDMIEGGAFRSQQFTDLVPGHYPPMEDHHEYKPPTRQEQQEDSLLQDAEPQVPIDVDAPVTEPAEGQQSQSITNPDTQLDHSASNIPNTTLSPNADSSIPHQSTSSSSSSYGPVRRRLDGKSGPAALYRPAEMQETDFSDMMREIVPRLVQHATASFSQAESPDADMMSNKRVLEGHDRSEEPAAVRPKPSDYDENLAVEALSVEAVDELVDMMNDATIPIEVLIANYMQKKTAKELPPSNNEPFLQRLVDDSKRTEWDTILEKGAVKIHYGKKAAQIKEQQSHRFIGSRFVITRKATEENQAIDENNPSTYRVKSRWCLQGHLDPDLDQKVNAGMLQSPTLSQMGRMLVMQLIASFQWELQLGDIKGAFLEAGPLPEQFRPLFASMPRGGIPSVPSDAVLEITGNLYGQNDAPLAWHKTFDEEAIKIGWERSRYDACLYFLRDEQQKLCGIMGVHVDDTAIGGMGPKFQAAVDALKKRFPYRKWRKGEGEFCGSYYTQDPATKSIQMSQKMFAEKMKPASIPKHAKADDLLSEGQIRVLRAINGSLNWIASQSRPDLSVQTSFCQQAFPKPCIRHLKEANNAIRRAKQHKDLTITFKPIKPEQLCVSCHSDAAFANIGTHTQAGYILAFTETKIHKGEVASWTPVVWKSYKLPRAVSSTLSGESQALATATGTVEWMNLLLSEALDGKVDFRSCRSVLARRPPVVAVSRQPVVATDCKSLYDHLISPSSPTAVDDRRTSIDIVIIRESNKITGAQVRWLPTEWMIADGLTKDKADPICLLRSCVRAGTYQISPEEHVLAR